MNTNYYENEVARYWVEGKILFSEYKISFLDLNAVTQGVSLRHESFKGKSYPLYVDIRKVRNVTKGARDYICKEDGIKNVNAAAIHASSLATILIAKFFLTFNKPNVPTQYFLKREDAVEWLSMFL